ncbi:MAG: hypothetical protein U0Q18_03150 [Bryobacteraceae bacterium]
MKIVGAVAFAVLAVGPSSAQWGSVGGFGNVAFPGLGHAPAGRNPWGNVAFPAGRQNFNAYSSVTNPGFASNLGGIVTGFNPYNGAPAGGGRARGPRGSAVFAYPVFVGGYGYGNDQAPVEQQQPTTVVVYPPAQPPVIINQNFAPGTADQAGQAADSAASNYRYYQAPIGGGADTAASSTSGDTSYYLIAFKDHTIYSAVAYYVEGDTLHYFTAGNVHNQASLSLVDRPLTEQLNRERSVDVRLPH